MNSLETIQYYKDLKEFVEKNNIFNDTKITIRFLKLDELDTEKYKVIGVSTDNSSTDQELKSKVVALNEELGKRASYNMFYLLKELITYLSGKENNVNKYSEPYTYYRGQSCNWKTVPSLLRNISNEDSKKFYYEDFENIYSKISKEFPEEIEYVDLNSNREKRAEQLSILQHYELKTNLIDITENPFIAMLFMVESSIFDKPQIELYRINPDNPFFQDGVKFPNNKRIKVQKGAFINYERLFDHYKNGKFNIEETQKIDRIIISMEFDFNASIEILENYKKLAKEYPEEGFQLPEEEYEKSIEKYEKFLKGEEEEKISRLYREVISDIKQKLKEYNYHYEELFPDLSDYIKNISKRYR
ncbi:FRG domain-containing protein [Gemella cuniculi]|uniref:FRG domain-containing protein n=1 Tax=Gemella cuniculi TaxID=150240 RepID=UPI0003FDA7B5|nr:FRG domain-containing protein [Gemella cuniculi]